MRTDRNGPARISIKKCVPKKARDGQTDQYFYASVKKKSSKRPWRIRTIARPLKDQIGDAASAAGFWFNGGGTSTVVASVNPDGTVALVEGSPDIGGTRTSVAIQFAEVLNLPIEDIKPNVTDTDAIGQTDGTGGSRVTFATGWASYEAAQDVKRQMIERAATLWEISKDDIVFEDGSFRSKIRRIQIHHIQRTRRQSQWRGRSRGRTRCHKRQASRPGIRALNRRCPK